LSPPHGERLVVTHLGGSERGGGIAALHLQPQDSATRGPWIVDAKYRSRFLHQSILTASPRRLLFGACLHDDGYVLP